MFLRILKYIPFLFAIRFLLLVNCIVLFFHCLVITQIIPFNIVWAGKLKNLEEMYVFETVSILINLFFLFIVLARGGIWKVQFPKQVIDIILWIFVVIFSLNTIGNLFAASKLERFVATPLTFLLALFCLRVTSQIENYFRNTNN